MTARIDEVMVLGTAVAKADLAKYLRDREDVLPSDFGGLGDGVADDRAAIQAAFDRAAADGRMAVIPPGTWNVSAGVTLHGGVRVSAAVLRLGGDASGTARRRLWLPAGGVEVAAGDRAVVIAEIGLAPSFDRDPAGAPTVDAGVIGRVGARWYLHPAFSFDASVGYQVDQATSAAGARAVVDWDIRLGGELFVPWGAIACKTAGLFCSP